MTEHQKKRIHQLRAKGVGYLKISQILSVSVNTVKTYCRRNNLCGPKIHAGNKPAMSNSDISICKNCGKFIEQITGTKRRKFCTDECRVSWWNSHSDCVNQRAIYHLACQYCRRHFDSYGNKNRKYCSHACYIADRYKQHSKMRDCL